MATITSNGPSPIPKLKEQITLLERLAQDTSTADLNEKMDELIEAVREITSR